MVNSTTQGWAKLTWDDLETWAGSGAVSRGRSYQRSGHVKKLGISAKGDLLATVVGTERYATKVSLDPGGKAMSLESFCTCPVGFRCKHAVATVAEYIQAVADGRTVPLAAEDDPRWDELVDGGRVDEDEDRDDDEDDSLDEDEEDDVPVKKSRTRKPKSDGLASSWDGRIERHIREKSRAELADLVWTLVRRFPEVYQEFRERIALQSGDVAGLLAEARREIREVTSELAWSNRWNDEGHIPNYTPIRQRFERLLELGHADEVVSLGHEFLEKGLEQVEEAHDEEGEIATAFAECLPVVFQAVMRSSLAPPDRLLFAIDAVLADHSDVVGESADVVFDAPWEPEDWSSVADALIGRLKPPSSAASKEDNLLTDFRRDSLTDFIANALENAGRSEELVPLYESEARITGSYVRLVDHLVANRRFEDAGRWAKQGIAATVAKYPGISDQLAEKFGEIARGREQWDVVAAHAARRFFDQPSATTFEGLIQAAGKAGVEASVRGTALRFLESGIGPFRVTAPPTAPTLPPTRSTAKRKAAASTPKPVAVVPRLEVDPAWPLPVPDYLIPLMSRRPAFDPGPRPHLEVLLEMAIAAKEPVEVLRWFDRMRQAKPEPGYRPHSPSYADRVAAAVSDSHPARALEIYTAALNAQLPNAQPSAYEAAAGYLKKLRPIYEALERLGEWEALVASIREKYRNRPRFMEILESVDGRTILDSARPKRK